MNSVCRYAVPLHLPGQFMSKVDICQFAPAVCKNWHYVVVKVGEVQLLIPVNVRSNVNYPAWCTLFEAVQ